MQIEKWARESDPLQLSDGWYESLLFDRAVTWFGRYVENKLTERDKEGNARYSLEDILGSAETYRQNVMGKLRAMFGVMET